ncbi:hypothetical protein C8R47DRAFT_987091 [Mycena vitilis]|nr:hypothetical protein C8R47DRAFT_987091 [Mycena vitilis]
MVRTDEDRKARHTGVVDRPITSRNRPQGLIWDSVNYSCGYDALFTILGNLWSDDPARWSTSFGGLSPYLGDFASAMRAVKEGSITFEQARNIIRRNMHSSQPEDFPTGRRFASVDLMARLLLPSKTYAVGRQRCPECPYFDPISYGMLESYLSAGLSDRQTYPEGVPIQNWMADYLRWGRRTCPRCSSHGVRSRLYMDTAVRDVPALILIDINHSKLVFNDLLTFEVQGAPVNMRLRGIVYGGQGHFTSRLISKHGDMWFHDGITTGKDCVSEVNFHALEDKLVLHNCGEKKAVCVIYARDF